jgi:hypothetical protein
LGLETRPAAWSLLRQACLVSESPGISAGNVSISFIPHRFAGLIDDGAKLKYLVGKTSGEGGRETRPERKKAPPGIFKTSYARAEVDRDEYLQRCDDLLEVYWIAFCL